MKLLIVDDSKIIRNKINRCFKDEFQIVGLASNGSEAIEIFEQEIPEVVTMDLTMPEMDGIECIKNIMSKQPSTTILVISALADKATAITALKNGAHGFLCKPFTDKQLTDAFNELLP